MDTPTTLRIRQRQREKRSKGYVGAFNRELEHVSPKCSKSADILVWFHLHALQRMNGPEAWVWADMGVLRSWEIRPRSYQRALVKLAKANLLELDAQPGRKTRVRLKPMEPERAGG